MNNLSNTLKLIVFLISAIQAGFFGQPKPDSAVLDQVLNDIGGPSESFLFVCDRQHINLLPPAEKGLLY